MSQISKGFRVEDFVKGVIDLNDPSLLGESFVSQVDALSLVKKNL